jgi:hypothetical protein
MAQGELDKVYKPPLNYSRPPATETYTQHQRRNDIDRRIQTVNPCKSCRSTSRSTAACSKKQTVFFAGAVVPYRPPLHMTWPAPPIEVVAHTPKISRHQRIKRAIEVRIAAAYHGGSQNSRMDAQWADYIARNSQATGYEDEPMDYGGSSRSHNVDDLCDHNYNASRKPRQESSHRRL